MKLKNEFCKCICFSYFKADKAGVQQEKAILRFSPQKCLGIGHFFGFEPTGGSRVGERGLRPSQILIFFLILTYLLLSSKIFLSPSLSIHYFSKRKSDPLISFAIFSKIFKLCPLCVSIFLHP